MKTVRLSAMKKREQLAVLREGRQSTNGVEVQRTSHAYCWYSTPVALSVTTMVLPYTYPGSSHGYISYDTGSHM